MDVKRLLVLLSPAIVVGVAACSETPNSEQAPAPIETPPAATPVAPVEETPDAAAVLDTSTEAIADAVKDIELSTELLEEENLLPDLLNDEEEKKKMKLSGKVLTDKEATALTDKIEGAEVKIEVTTD